MTSCAKKPKRQAQIGVRQAAERELHNSLRRLAVLVLRNLAGRYDSSEVIGIVASRVSEAFLAYGYVNGRSAGGHLIHKAFKDALRHASEGEKDPAKAGTFAAVEADLMKSALLHVVLLIENPRRAKLLSARYEKRSRDLFGNLIERSE